MDNVRFKKLIDKEKSVLNKIGTLSEKTLHRIVKNYYCEDENFQEVKIGSYYADVLMENKIIEIQTRQFFKLIPKIEFFLKNGYEVRVVYPSFYQKQLYWVNKDTGEITKGKMSPRKGKVYDVFDELYSLRCFLDNPSFKVTILLMNLNEYRLLDGWGRDGKRGSHRIDRIPEEIIEEINLDCLSDFNIFLPLDLPSQFKSVDYSKKAKISLKSAQMALIILTTLNVVKRVGKEKNNYIYIWNQKTS